MRDPEVGAAKMGADRGRFDDPVLPSLTHPPIMTHE